MAVVAEGIIVGGSKSTAFTLTAAENTIMAAPQGDATGFLQLLVRTTSATDWVVVENLQPGLQTLEAYDTGLEYCIAANGNGNFYYRVADAT